MSSIIFRKLTDKPANMSGKFEKIKYCACSDNFAHFVMSLEN